MQTRNIFVSKVTPFDGFMDDLEEDLKTIESNYCGTSFPLNPQTGQHCFRTDRGVNGLEYIFTGAPAVGEAGWVETAILASIGVEVIAARGSKSTLAQFLAVAFNLDGTLKAGTSLNPSQWFTPSLVATHVDGTHFTVPGDQTDIFTATRRLKATLTASIVYSEVVTAVYNAGPDNTTVQIADSVLDATLAGIEYSLFTPIADGDSALSMAVLTQATETLKGIVELDTDAEAIAGTDTARALTAANLKAVLASPPAIGGVVPNTVLAKLSFTAHNATENITAISMWGNVHKFNGAYIGTLPAAVAGMSGLFEAMIVSAFSIKAGPSDKFVLNGTELDNGDKITSTGAKGDTVFIMCDAVNTWRASLMNALFTDGGP